MSGLENFKKDFAGKRVLILGLGILGGGVKLSRFLNQVGCKITISDQKNHDELSESISKLEDLDITYSLEGHDESLLKEVDFIIRNPAIPKNHNFLNLAKEKNIPIYMEAALFAKYSQKPVIGITGTRGKTTTTLLIHHILSKAIEKKANMAGNIPGTCALSLLENEEEKEIWGAVLELSSWQLQGFDDLKISPQIAVLTNIYPDHLNRYSSIGEYIGDKEVIVKYQEEKDHLIFNGENELVTSIAIKSNAQIIDFSKRKVMEGTKLNLIGDHNLQNTKAAVEVCLLVGVDKDDIKEAIKSFYPVPFRLETVGVVDGVKYINDSTSTTPNSFYAAMTSVDSPKIIIMGGNSKNLPWDFTTLYHLNAEYLVKEVFLLPGTGSDEIANHINHVRVEALEEAVERAHKTAEKGDTVLFSPGFTSFSQFKNEFDRGIAFNQLVENL